MKKWTILPLITFAVPAAALEPPPLTNLQIACYGNEYAVRAHVVDAHSYICEKRGPNCFPNYVGATAVVDEVIAPSREGMRVGDTIRVSFSVIQPIASVRRSDVRYDGSIVFPDNHADEITDDFAKSQLVGRTLLLVMASKGRSLMGGIPAQVDEPYRAEAYPAEDAEWFRKTWASAECRKEQTKAESARRKLGLTRKN